MSEITKLGSKVDYSSQYNPKELEFFPRAPRRTEFKAPMYGIDIWTCFEVSFLLPNGCPTYNVLRISNPADSENIFESKSLKLYLNSFNNTVFSGIDEVVNTISNDLSKGTGKRCNISVIRGLWDIDETNIDYLGNEIENFSYKYDPTLLKSFPALKESDFITFNSNLLRSNCEVTNQPDWSNIKIQYLPKNRILDKKSFLQYIVSYRNHQEFHEPTCERIYQDLYQVLEPEFLLVICQYTRRGGIDINPVRCSDPLFDFKSLLYTLPKQLQQ